MRPYLFLFFILLFSQMVFAQFFVVKINEQVFADGQLLKPRTRISPEVELRFSSNNAYAHVLSTSRGHFVLSGEKGKKNQKGEFLAALKEAIIPSDQFQAAATRAGSLEKAKVIHFDDKYDVKAYFRETIVLLDTAYYEFAAKNFPVDDNHYFCIMQELEDTIISQRLPIEENALQLTASVFQDAKAGQLNANISTFTMTYVDKVKNKYQEFGPFKLHFLSDEEKKEIQEEIGGMRQFLSLPSESEFIQQHALPFLYTYYGKMSVPDVRRLMSR